MQTIDKIGFAGMGIMGAAMAVHLLQAGYSITVFNRTQDKCRPLLEKGADLATSFAQLAGSCDVLICMLSDADALHQNLDDISSNVKARVIINMSTVSPHESNELRRRSEILGLNYIEAPVAGSKPAAEAGEMVVLCSGQSESVEQYKSLLSCFSKQIVYCGEGSRACSLKLSLNALLANMTLALCESEVICERLGVEPDLFFETLAMTALNSPLFNIKRPLMTQHEYPAQFPLTHMLKDLNLIQTALDDMDLGLPLLQAARTQYVNVSTQVDASTRDMSIVRELWA